MVSLTGFVPSDLGDADCVDEEVEVFSPGGLEFELEIVQPEDLGGEPLRGQQLDAPEKQGLDRASSGLLAGRSSGSHERLPVARAPPPPPPSKSAEEEAKTTPQWRPPACLRKVCYYDEDDEDFDDGGPFFRPDACKLPLTPQVPSCHQLRSLVFPTESLLNTDDKPVSRGSASRTSSAGSASSTREFESHERCGGEALRTWLEKVRARVQHLRVGASSDTPTPISGSLALAARLRKRPQPDVRLPSIAPQWQPLDAAFFLLTQGAFDPRVDGRDHAPAIPSAAAQADPSSVLISVICPTTEQRHAFHPLLYANFVRQTHVRRELVVIDTGTRPSAFLRATAQQDPRVIYRFFCVVEREAPEEASMFYPGTGRLLQPPMPHAARRRKSANPRRAESNWSLGVKRNVACHLAQGSVIAHFDDDDLYAPCYLSAMLKNLLQGLRRSKKLGELCENSGDSDAPLGPIVTTLSEWHLLDLADQNFGFLSPQTDPLIPENSRESMVLGYGFTYVYTRAAWELVPFPDVDWSEDGEFVTALRERGIPIALVRSDPKLCAHEGGLAAHTYHRDTTSGGEFAGFLRLGLPVPTPESFVELLPIIRQVAQITGSKVSECHWLRRELHYALRGMTSPMEYGISDKGGFLKKGLIVDHISDVASTGALLPLLGSRQPRTAPTARQARGAFSSRLSQSLTLAGPLRGTSVPPLLGAVTRAGRQQQLYTQEVD